MLIAARFYTLVRTDIFSNLRVSLRMKGIGCPVTKSGVQTIKFGGLGMVHIFRPTISSSGNVVDNALAHVTYNRLICIAYKRSTSATAFLEKVCTHGLVEANTLSADDNALLCFWGLGIMRPVPKVTTYGFLSNFNAHYGGSRIQNS